jgi:hypothetical protein
MHRESGRSGAGAFSIRVVVALKTCHAALDRDGERGWTLAE